MTTPSRSLAIAAFVVLLATLMVPAAQAQTSPLQSQVGQAYTAVRQAESQGGNVTGLVAQLNQALSLIQKGDAVNSTNPARAQALYSQASSLLQQVITNSTAVGSAGAAAVAASRTALVAETVVLGALAVVAYLYTPRVFWAVWRRLYKGWRVRKP